MKKEHTKNVTPENLERIIEDLKEKVGKSLNKRIESACNKTGWSFYSGMGTWYFESKSGKVLDMDRDCSGPEVLKRLCILLHKYENVSEYFVSNYCDTYEI